MDLFIFTCVFLGAIAITFGVIAIYHNLTTAPVVTPVVAKQDGEYILTKIGTVIVPKNCKPTRRLQLAMLRASHISTPFGCTDDSKVVFVQDAHYRYKAYYVGTK
jgi:hypothetical protein